MVNALEERPDIDIVYGDMVVVDAQEGVLQRKPAGDYRELLSDNCVRACFLYRRKVQEVLGGYAEDLFLAEDYDFWLRASVQFQMLPIRQDLYDYREHPGSLTALHKQRQQEAAARCLEKNLPHLTWAPVAEKAAVYLSLARAAQRAGDLRTACRCAYFAFRLAPLHILQTVARKMWRS